MYYNPTTQEKLTRDELKRHLNMSFPIQQESIEGWFLIHNDSIPNISNGQTLTPSTIELVNGHYVQTYTVSGSAQAPSITLEERIQELEEALLEIAEIVGVS